MARVVVGMSGGVDSSVAAYQLKKQGADVLGVFMRNWEDSHDAAYRHDHTHGCVWEQDFEDVRRVCDMLDIPYMTFDFVGEYRQRVFDLFIQELEQGRTPNPDIVCNQEIKFQLFAEKALALPDVEAIATGHYAAIRDGRLCRPADKEKDQTYFLYRINPSILDKVIFPLENLTKKEVRTIAAEQHFPNADKKDSTGICFIGDIDYNTFIRQYIDEKPGNITTVEGEVIGRHDGLHLYTIGQRRGVNIGGTGPYYVVEKNMEDNELIVTNDSEDRRLYQSGCTVDEFHFLNADLLPEHCEVQVRYRQHAVGVEVEGGSTAVELVFDEPIRAVTAGQSAVLYADGCVIGGGVISRTRPALE